MGAKHCTACGKKLAGLIWNRRTYEDGEEHIEYYCNKCALANWLEPDSEWSRYNGLMLDYAEPERDNG